MRIFIIALLIAFAVSLTLGFALLLTRTSEIIPGATAYQLTRNCELICFDRTLQPVNTLALACPGVDLIRLWPLPIVQPWDDDTNPCDEIGSRCVEL